MDRKLSSMAATWFRSRGGEVVEQASMIRPYIIWRNNHAYDERLRQIIDRANVA